MIRSEKLPLRYVVTSGLYWSRWMWFMVAATAPLFTYMGMNAREGSIPVLVCFWIMLLGIAIASAWASVHSKGVRRRNRRLKLTMIWLPGTWHAYRDLDHYVDWLYEWTNYWTANPHSAMTPWKARELFEGVRMVVVPSKWDVSVLEKNTYIDFAEPWNKPEEAKAVTYLGLNLIEVWVGEVDNQHGMWEYEWGHILAQAEWGWSGEASMLEKRKETRLLRSDA